MGGKLVRLELVLNKFCCNRLHFYEGNADQNIELIEKVILVQEFFSLQDNKLTDIVQEYRLEERAFSHRCWLLIFLALPLGLIIRSSMSIINCAQSLATRVRSWKQSSISFAIPYL